MSKHVGKGGRITVVPEDRLCHVPTAVEFHRQTNRRCSAAGLARFRQDEGAGSACDGKTKMSAPSM